MAVSTVVGLPDITPVPLLRLRPAGSEPVVTLQESGGFPPDVVTVWLYAAVRVPAGNEVVVILKAVYIFILRDLVATALFASIT